MATSGQPDFPAFNCRDDPTSLGVNWKNWIGRFENLMLALNIKDKKRKRAMLLFYAGKETHDIYNTLKEYENEEYDESQSAFR